MVDALETFGTVFDTDMPRDAVHVACISGQAQERLQPGQHVGYKNGVITTVGDKIGIIDPFIIGPIKFGERCWIFIYPRTVTGLRHAWEHPDIKSKESDVEEDPKWDPSKPWESPAGAAEYIAREAINVGVSVPRLMDGARNWITTGQGMYMGEREEWLNLNIIVSKGAGGMDVRKEERSEPSDELSSIANASLEDLEAGKVG